MVGQEVTTAFHAVLATTSFGLHKAGVVDVNGGCEFQARNCRRINVDEARDSPTNEGRSAQAEGLSGRNGWVRRGLV
jgi:hypothetical protein